MNERANLCDPAYFVGLTGTDEVPGYVGRTTGRLWNEFSQPGFSKIAQSSLIGFVDRIKRKGLAYPNQADFISAPPGNLTRLLNALFYASKALKK